MKRSKASRTFCRMVSLSGTAQPYPGCLLYVMPQPRCLAPLPLGAAARAPQAEYRLSSVAESWRLGRGTRAAAIDRVSGVHVGSRSPMHEVRDVDPSTPIRFFAITMLPAALATGLGCGSDSKKPATDASTTPTATTAAGGAPPAELLGSYTARLTK